MAIRLTKTSKVIFAISIVVLSAALGFLIWRVNQEDTVAPTDSDAAGGAGACCDPDVGCVSGWKCVSQACSEPEGAIPCTAGASGCDTCGVGYRCRTFLPENGSVVTCINSTTHTCQVTTSHTCVADDSGEPPTEGDCKDTICEWPQVTMSGRIDPNDPVCRCEPCTGVVAGDPYSCSGNPPTCNPGGCPTGYVDCGDSANHEGGDCTKQDSISCVSYHPDCNNPTYVFRYCKPETPPVTENVCDAGGWVTRPTGNMSFTSDISYSATATDSNGIDTDSISVKLCTGTVSTCTTGQTLSPTKTGTTSPITISGVLSSAAQRLAAGTYTMTITWKDSLGITGANCTLTSTFTVLPQETNPNWDITKSVVGLCIDEGTENPKSELSYTITVRNTGDGAGTISKVEDVLDAKVLAGFVQTGITTPGVFASGKITWNYPTPLSIAAGTTKTYTYKLVIDKDHFGTYANEVTLTPVGSAAIKATANILADCDVAQSDWTITKAVTEACIDEGTANPKSELSYVITVRNTGTGSGTITKIEDVLDTKVLASFVQPGITSPGAFANGKILWNYATTPLSFTAGETKTFLYKLIVDKDNFGTYANTVTLTPSVGATKQATANIGADCTITEEEKPPVPETGIFDNTLGRVAAGFVLVVFGVLIYNIPNGILRTNGEKKYKYRVRFEKKVANR